MLQFRKATPLDIPQVERLVNSAYRGEYSKVGWTTEAFFLDGQRTDSGKLLELIESKDEFLLLAFSDQSEGSLLASVAIKQESPESLYFGMLTVEPQLQGKGLGKSLLDQVEQFARKHGCEVIRLTIIHLRSELISYYERRGFKLTGKYEPFPSNDPRFGIPKVEGMMLLEMIKRI